MSNLNKTVLYTGVTADLYNRVYEHKNGLGGEFTKKYNCYYLIYYQFFKDIESAILKEKQIKKWKRAYKENVINTFNPTWKDLYPYIEDFH